VILSGQYSGFLLGLGAMSMFLLAASISAFPLFSGFVSQSMVMSAIPQQGPLGSSPALAVIVAALLLM